MSGHLSGRIALLADVSKVLGVDLRPRRITVRDRIRLYFWLWRGWV